MSNSNVLPLFNFSGEIGVAGLELADMVKFPLTRFTGGKRVARALQGNLIAGINGDGRKGALSATRLADAVGRR